MKRTHELGFSIGSEKKRAKKYISKVLGKSEYRKK
jgi:hypothetical protein